MICPFCSKLAAGCAHLGPSTAPWGEGTRSRFELPEICCVIAGSNRHELWRL